MTMGNDKGAVRRQTIRGRVLGDVVSVVEAGRSISSDGISVHTHLVSEGVHIVRFIRDDGREMLLYGPDVHLFPKDIPAIVTVSSVGYRSIRLAWVHGIERYVRPTEMEW